MSDVSEMQRGFGPCSYFTINTICSSKGDTKNFDGEERMLLFHLSSRSDQ